MKDRPLVYIIVLNWNGVEHLGECFSSLNNLEYANTRLIMVDNGSDDGSVDFVKQHFPKVEIIMLRKNIGFAAGNNAGMRHAMKQGAKYIALLNNDTAVHPRWISELVAVAEADSQVGVCATKMLYYDNRKIINGFGVVMNRLCHCWDKYNKCFIDSVKNTEDVLAACGGAFFIRAECIRKVGYFDPAYFIYLEDVDLCIRLWNIGYKVITVPLAMIYHKFSATMKEGSSWKNYIVLRNRFRLLLKLLPLNMVSYALPRMIYREIRSGLNYTCSAEFKKNLDQLKVVFAILKESAGILRYRLRHRNVCRHFPLHLINQSNSLPKDLPLFHPSSINKESITNRILMGVNDYGLRDGWFSLMSDGIRTMSYRLMSKEASALLYNPPGGKKYLQIQIAQPEGCKTENGVQILWNKKKVGALAPSTTWQTLHLNLEAAAGIGEITLIADRTCECPTDGHLGNYSFKIADISLLEDASPFLRYGVT